MVRTSAGSALRFCSTSALADYLRGDRGENPRRLSTSEELEEAWFLGLRLRAGVEWEALVAEFGAKRVEIFEPIVTELCSLELVTEEGGLVRLTRRGVLFSNEVFARFIETPDFQTQ
jgi:oxygen-independent coproporphyrinogen-3 oxidase